METVTEARAEEVRDQRIRRVMAHRCSVTCVLPAGHDGLHMRQDGSRCELVPLVRISVKREIP